MKLRESRGELPVGTVLGDAYQLVRRIATGGMGTVYQAEHLRLGKRCAVKVMASELAANSEALTRFHREVEVTAKLDHPNIVQVMDFGAAPGGEPYLVMEYLDGEDLAQRLRRVGRFTPPAVAHIVKQVASALAATHAGGIVHRDLKPANIILLSLPGGGAADSDFVKVVDFGISKVKHAGPRLTRASVLMGTPHYMPPEQASGRIDAIDHRSDQWALACIAWEMLAGQGPFWGKDVTALLFQIVHEDPLPQAARTARLPAPVFQVLQRALSKRPRDRFPGITAFSRALEAALLAPAPTEHPTAAGPEAPPLRRLPTTAAGTIFRALGGDTVMRALRTLNAGWSSVARTPPPPPLRPSELWATLLRRRHQRAWTGPRRRWVLALAAPVVIIAVLIDQLAARPRATRPAPPTRNAVGRGRPIQRRCPAPRWPPSPASAPRSGRRRGPPRRGRLPRAGPTRRRPPAVPPRPTCRTRWECRFRSDMPAAAPTPPGSSG